MLYNLQAAVSNFEYVPGFGSIIYAVIVPLLTMRTIAEERRQKTDQLLYSLPLSTTRVVLGKYLALLAVFLVPLAIIACYPLIFAQYGEVYLPTSYGTLLAFFLMGAALIAVGIFLSSLTDNQGFRRRPVRGGDPFELLQRQPLGIRLLHGHRQRGHAVRAGRRAGWGRLLPHAQRDPVLRHRPDADGAGDGPVLCRPEPV